jgi:hypothetical protein
VVKNETGEIAIKITTTYYAGSFQTVEAQKKLNNFFGCKKDKIAIFPKNNHNLITNTIFSKIF